MNLPLKARAHPHGWDPSRSTSPSYGRIYAVVRRIPRGRVCSYGEVGRKAGCGARQVGYALDALRSGTPLPWHRVLNASGGISLRGADAVTQRLRLEREGIQFTGRGVVDLSRFGWPRAARRAAP